MNRGYALLLILTVLVAVVLSLLLGGKPATKVEVKMVESNATLITVYDNYKHEQGLETGWGFGCLVRADKNVLFDTGADSETLLGNMEKLGIDPGEVDIVVLSHEHFDHIGGLSGFLEENPDVEVYALKSFPDSVKRKIRDSGAECVEVGSATEITGAISTTGELGTSIREQSLMVETPKGLVVLTGCAHPGVVSIVERVKELSDRDIHLVMGGFHLGGASDDQLRSIISRFKELGVERAAPCHCSGERARELFAEEYGEDYIANGVGRVIEL